MNPGIYGLNLGFATPPLGLLGKPRPVPLPDAYGYDADAQTYIEAVESADKRKLEAGVRVAINNFVIGLKSDGIWDRISNSLLMCGARTVAGAAVSLVGPTTSVTAFVNADYNRKTGLSSSGNGSKLIETNFIDNLPRNNFHLAIYATTPSAQAFQSLVVGNPNNGTATNRMLCNNPPTNLLLYGRSDSAGFVSLPSVAGLAIVNRTGLNVLTGYVAGATGINTRSSVDTTGQSYRLFGGGTLARLAFYSCGLSINPRQLELRIAQLLRDIEGAI